MAIVFLVLNAACVEWWTFGLALIAIEYLACFAANKIIYYPNVEDTSVYHLDECVAAIYVITEFL